MANALKLEEQIAIISALVEGNSIRSVERMTDVHRDTIIRLMVRVADECFFFNDKTIRDLDTRRVECDEIWGYVQKKQRQVRDFDDRSQVGDQYTFVAMDADSKLVISHLTGKRGAENATDLMLDLKSRLRNRVQISTDGFEPYVAAVKHAFGEDVDYGLIVKTYEEQPAGRGRYSPPRIAAIKKDYVVDNPNMKHISTSYVERQNLTMRMQVRRLTRLTNAFSKRVDNLRAALNLHFTHYNFVRFHSSIGCTPAMAAGVYHQPMTVRELVERAA
jgi:IS1 family transposase